MPLCRQRQHRKPHLSLLDMVRVAFVFVQPVRVHVPVSHAPVLVRAEEWVRRRT